MEKSDLDTLKILEDMIRRVVREELERNPGRTVYLPSPLPPAPTWPTPRPPFQPYFVGTPQDQRVWGIDVPTAVPAGTPVA